MMFKEFKEFAMQGNMLDMAIGVVLGGAFKAVVDALVAILTDLVAVATGGVNFEELAFTIAGLNVKIGPVINSFISFLIIAFILFMIVKAMNAMKRTPEVVEEESTKVCPFCKSLVDIEATRCPHCTSELG